MKLQLNFRKENTDKKKKEIKRKKSYKILRNKIPKQQLYNLNRREKN